MFIVFQYFQGILYTCCIKIEPPAAGWKTLAERTEISDLIRPQQFKGSVTSFSCDSYVWKLQIVICSNKNHQCEVIYIKFKPKCDFAMLYPNSGETGQRIVYFCWWQNFVGWNWPIITHNIQYHLSSISSEILQLKVIIRDTEKQVDFLRILFVVSLSI